ncbi:hypothetical protein BV898_07174 [Hypsibius exemplaris]|uniref:Uncharacterized protein n=1 Tax=Hypsibius exemplaris TaxID=2072580 RepID=A0A1W0WU59_HYPEX|nr:hypothetical protein BV898_07174 [Hypsibius exemplaris]
MSTSVSLYVLLLSGWPVFLTHVTGDDACAADLKYKIITQNWANGVGVVYGLGSQHADDPNPGVYLKAIIGIASHIDFNVFANANHANDSAALQAACLAVHTPYAQNIANAGFDTNNFFAATDTISGEDDFHAILVNYILAQTNMYEAYKASLYAKNPTRYQSVVIGFKTNELHQDDAVARRDGAACVKWGARTSHFGELALRSGSDKSTDCATPFLLP